MEENVNGQPIVDKSKAFSAIDVGTTKIVALVGCSRENGTLEILGKGEVDSVGLKVGQVANVAYASASIREAVKFARETAGFFPEDVVVGVAGRHIRTTKHCVPRNRVNPDAPITQEELDEGFDVEFPMTKEGYGLIETYAAEVREDGYYYASGELSDDEPIYKKAEINENGEFLLNNVFVLTKI